MRKSENRYAQAVVKNQIPKKIFESFNKEQEKKLEQIQAYLESEKIEFIRGSSLGRLSKYYSEGPASSSKYPMKVVRKVLGSDQPLYSNINEATDLFQKFSKSHAVNRLHCYFDLLSVEQQNKIKELIA